MRRTTLVQLAAGLILLGAAFAPQALAQTCQKPVMLIVQDRSTSMLEKTASGCSNCTSMWAGSRKAVSLLTNKFENRLQFGLEMFPGTNSTAGCAKGNIVRNLGATPTSILNAYKNNPPAPASSPGFTPMATSLGEALSYLQGRNLTVPAYVLLVTDGLPNCNMNLDLNTCTTVSPNCTGSAKCCLDDARTKSKAQALFQAGFKVFVVGFGEQSNTNSNKVVLNAIAKAGGTGTALVASNQSQLEAALDQVALQTAGSCCEDACTLEVRQCDGEGQVMECVRPEGATCTEWKTTECGEDRSCESGSCQTCQDQCQPGEASCQGSLLQTCAMGPGGCFVWEASDCGGGRMCDQGACTTCSQTCSPGSGRCGGDVPETCVVDDFGCTRWQAGPSCLQGCAGGHCYGCATDCTVGVSRCGDEGLERCEYGAGGCGQWAPMESCPGDEACLDGTCAIPCTLGEFPCPGTMICVDSPAGRVCVADPAAAAAPPIPTEPEPQQTGTPLTPGRGSSTEAEGAGCGCTGASGGALALGGWLALAVLGRRRSR